MDAPLLIFETVYGSRAYDLAREGSDLDLRGVIIGPVQWYAGFAPSPEQIEYSADHVHFEVRKFLRLAAANNPTILELLFTDGDLHRTVHPIGRELLDARRSFLSQRVAETFGRYALSQLARIRRHRRWLLEPPKREPVRTDFGLSERPSIAKDQLGAAEALIDSGRVDRGDVDPQFLLQLDRERRYRAARKEWEQYRQWLAHRNAARAELEARFGYDTKHAMHLVRLSRMAIEILERGTVIVRRPDRDELLAVRDGAWTYDELIAQSDGLAEQISRAKARTALPAEPDEGAMNALCTRLVEEALRWR